LSKILEYILPLNRINSVFHYIISCSDVVVEVHADVDFAIVVFVDEFDRRLVTDLLFEGELGSNFVGEHTSPGNVRALAHGAVDSHSSPHIRSVEASV